MNIIYEFTKPESIKIETANAIEEFYASFKPYEETRFIYITRKCRKPSQNQCLRLFV